MTDDATGTLTRRDALAALSAAGVAVGGFALAWDSLDEDDPLGSHELETLIALARIVYPDAVDGVEEFVESYVAGRTRDSPERGRAIAQAVGTLDEYASAHEGTRYIDLPSERQETLLREMGLDVVDPDPEGVEPARLRYYLVNELLFALYTSPTGGRLVGLENPQGHPGGTDSYRRGPDE